MQRRDFGALAVVTLAGLMLHTPAGLAAPGEAVQIELGQLDGPIDAPAVAPPASPSLADPTVRFRWPFLAYKRWMTGNYVDLSPGAAISEYGCNNVSYDGHQGNDIGILRFLEMDEGRFVLAAAAGVVIDVDDGHDDRQTSCSAAPANYVMLRHDDGTVAYYWHFKRWSTEVAVGQSVHEGQILGQIGSSGCSTDPHLHFEIRDGATVWEPAAGACRAGVSLWKQQRPYIVDEPVEVWWAGITTVEPSRDSTREGMPGVGHVYQDGNPLTHYFWTILGNLHDGSVSRVTYLRPDTSVHADWSYNHTGFYAYSYWYWTTDLPPAGATGTWTVEYRVDEVLLWTTTFELDGSPSQPPVAPNRTIIVEHGIVREALDGSDADSELLRHELVSLPTKGRARLEGPRRRHFVYTPNPGASGTDSLVYRVVDAQGEVSAPGTITFDLRPKAADVLHFEEVDDHVAVPASPSLDVASALTIEAWVRRTRGSAGWQAIVDRRHPTLFNTYGYHLFLTGRGELAFGLGDGSAGTRHTGTTPVPLDRWVHVAGVWDGAAIRVYVDRIAEPGSTSFTGPIDYSGVTELRVGGSFVSGESFRGDFDEVRVWSAARSAAELASGGGCGFREAPLPATVRARWGFDGDTADASANGNDGVVFGQASFVRVDPGLPLDCTGLDTDNDGLADAADNCPLVPNPPQDDADGDGAGDVCDLCPATWSHAQPDSDRDGVGDPCDNCPFTGNTGQLDGDDDGTGDLCDPAPADPLESVPSAAIVVYGAHALGQSAFSWSPEPASASYDVLRMSRRQLAERYMGRCVSGADPDPTDTVFLEPDEPAVGEVFYYLVRGVSEAGTRGRAGLGGASEERDVRAKDCLMR